MTVDKYFSEPGTTVGKAGVGESGASSLLLHRVTGSEKAIAVLQNVKSDLCPSTGAVAVLVVNGVSVSHGIFTEVNSTVQAIVNPGDHVVAIVHTIPLFNDIECTKLGELEFTLEQGVFE